MKKFISTSVLLCAILILNAQSTPETYLEEFFTEIAAKTYTEAIESLPLSDNLKNDTAFINKLIFKLRNAPATFGKYCGYEQISAEEVSASYISYSYFIKYAKAPVKIDFTFYKPIDNWQINKVTIRNMEGRRAPVRSRNR